MGDLGWGRGVGRGAEGRLRAWRRRLGLSEGGILLLVIAIRSYLMSWGAFLEGIIVRGYLDLYGFVG